MSLKTVLRLAGALLVGLTVQAAVIFDGTFTGDFAAANWTLSTGVASTGFVDTTGAPSQIVVVGTDSETQLPAPPRNTTLLTQYTIQILSDGTVEFSWLYETFDGDGPQWDIAGYRLNSSYTDLSSTSGATLQSGVAQILVSSGDTFGFFVDSTDNFFGPALLTISQAPAEIPEPATITLAGAALMGLYFIRRRL